MNRAIFYPAMFAFDPAWVVKNVPDHNEMRVLIAVPRELNPRDERHDGTSAAFHRSPATRCS